jgi:hypothetical protein
MFPGSPLFTFHPKKVKLAGQTRYKLLPTHPTLSQVTTQQTISHDDTQPDKIQFEDSPPHIVPLTLCDSNLSNNVLSIPPHTIKLMHRTRCPTGTLMLSQTFSRNREKVPILPERCPRKTQHYVTPWEAVLGKCTFPKRVSHEKWHRVLAFAPQE